MFYVQFWQTANINKKNKIEKNIKDLEKLAQKQADLARNNKENDNKDITPKQEEMNKKFDAKKKKKGSLRLPR